MILLVNQNIKNKQKYRQVLENREDQNIIFAFIKHCSVVKEWDEHAIQIV
jgi:hypothetical protein